jgi:pimeloyl-ACP methyl ester carboxylesterase
VQHDLVVFVPGIMGSRLTRDGKDVWAMSKQALVQLRHPALTWQDFKLPAGIGDARPEGRHALLAAGLMEVPDVLPGLMSHLGYRDMRVVLGNLYEGQLLKFGYDWRLSNRVSAAALKEDVERALGRWRERAATLFPGCEEPKVVFLCHSMGGLVTRYYLEKLGGREITRALVTIGTPYQGAAKAIRFLTGNALVPADGRAPVRRWISTRFAELCASFPSVAQLLPVYRAVMRPGSRRVTLEDQDVPGLDSPLVREAFAFHREIYDAWEHNQVRDSAGGYKVYSLGGRTHPTVHCVLLSPGKLEFPTWLDDSQEWLGDGTVPAESSLAWDLDGTGDGIWYGYRHAALPSEDAVALQLASICADKPTRRTMAGDGDFGMDAPDFAVAGEPFEVIAYGVDADRRVGARLRRQGEFDTAAVLLRPDGTGNLRATLTGAAGTWVLEVVAENPRVVHQDVVLIAER